MPGENKITSAVQKTVEGWVCWKWFVSGSHPLLPFTQECYQCKMAVCLSEPPASTLELLWSNASWDRSVCFCLHFWLSLSLLSNLSPSNMVSDGMEHCLYVIVPALICQSSSVAFQTNRAFRAYVRFITVTAYGLPSLSLWIINDSHSLRISHVTLWNICFAFFLFCIVISIPAKFVKVTVSSIAAHIRADSLTFTHSCW